MCISLLWVPAAVTQLCILHLLINDCFYVFHLFVFVESLCLFFYKLHDHNFCLFQVLCCKSFPCFINAPPKLKSRVPVCQYFNIWIVSVDEFRFPSAHSAYNFLNSIASYGMSFFSIWHWNAANVSFLNFVMNPLP